MDRINEVTDSRQCLRELDEKLKQLNFAQHHESAIAVLGHVLDCANGHINTADMVRQLQTTLGVTLQAKPGRMRKLGDITDEELINLHTPK